jgi:hypothetical protein
MIFHLSSNFHNISRSEQYAVEVKTEGAFTFRFFAKNSNFSSFFAKNEKCKDLTSIVTSEQYAVEVKTLHFSFFAKNEEKFEFFAKKRKVKAPSVLTSTAYCSDLLILWKFELK